MRDYEFYYTQDGSIGLYSYKDDDVYHSKFGALTEAWEKFIIPSGIKDRLNKTSELRVLDVCYGVGYNTKALMSYVINSDENILYERKLFQRIKKIVKKIKNNLKIKIKKLLRKEYIVSIDSNNQQDDNKMLSLPIETIQNNNSFEDLSRIKIDCLEMNTELVKISPFLKTIVTPQEVYTKIVPKIFNCFDTYWVIKNLIAKNWLKFAPKNKKNITELLNLRFNNDYDEIDSDYRLHKFVNYIIADKLLDSFKDDYINQEFKKKFSTREKKKFINNSLLKYTLYEQNFRYSFISRMNLPAFLHNIYYGYLSKRYKNARFKDVEQLFKLTFYVNDARKSILQLQGQYDYIFLDAFTYSKAPELWSSEFIAELYRRLSIKGFLLTYSNSALVRNTLLENNFYVGKILNEKTGKFIGTIAAKDKSLIKHPLTNYELGLCSTKAGIPYHDPTLNWPKERILKQREKDFINSDLMTSSAYQKFRAQRRENNE